MAKSHLKLVTPATVNHTVTPKRAPNADLRTREYLTEAEVERLMEAAKGNRWGHRDVTMILVGYRHGLRVSELVDMRWDQIEFPAGLATLPGGPAPVTARRAFPGFVGDAMKEKADRIAPAGPCRSAFAPPCVFQRLGGHGDVLGCVRHAGMAHELLEPPGIHAAIGLDRAGGVPQAMGMHWPLDPGIAAGGGDHLIDGEPGECVTPLAGEDVSGLRVLLTLEPLEAIGLVALHVVDAIDAALEASDLDCALAPVEVIPPQINQFAHAKAVQKRHQRDHVIAVPMTVGLQGSEQLGQFVLG